MSVNENLEALAMEFRSCGNSHDKFIVALKYEKEVNRLVLGRQWKEKPEPEDVLPDEWMPLSFYRHWKL
jgi:hypothetical protein